MPTIPHVRGLARCSRRVTVASILLLGLLLAGFASVVVQSQRQSREGLEERFALRGTLASRFISAYLRDVARHQKGEAQQALAGSTVTRDQFETTVDGMGIHAAVLLDARGRLLQVYPRNPAILGKDLGPSYPHLAAALQGRTGVSGLVPSAARGAPIVAVAVPFSSVEGGRVLGMAIDLETSPLVDYLENSIPFSAEGRLVDAKNNLITMTGEPVRGAAFWSSTAIAGTPWRLQLATPKATLYAPVSGLARWVPWALFAGFSAAAIGILLLFLRLLDSRTQVAGRNREVIRLMQVQQRFIASTSHELRTPLTSVLGYLDVLLKGSAGPFSDQQRAFLDIARRNAGRLLELVADLMLAAEIDARKLKLDREPLALEDLARESVESALPQAHAKGVELVLGTGTPANVVADRRRISQVLTNLVSNAVKFTPENGRVEVRSFRDNGHAVIEVADNGMGIPEAEQDRLFTRFFRSSNALAEEIPGSGLGLAIAKQLTDLHGGHLGFTTSEGVGTTFRVELPSSQ